jgi:hypothetical protein
MVMVMEGIAGNGKLIPPLRGIADRFRKTYSTVTRSRAMVSLSDSMATCADFVKRSSPPAIAGLVSALAGGGPTRTINAQSNGDQIRTSSL